MSEVAAVNGNDNVKISVATQTLQEAVAYFLSRYTANHDDATWQEIKDKLVNRFGNTLAQMRKLKKKEGEFVSLWYYWIQHQPGIDLVSTGPPPLLSSPFIISRGYLVLQV